MRWFSYFHDGILVFGKASLLASPSSQDHTDFGQCCGSKLVPMLGMPRIRNIQFRLVCSSGSIVGACAKMSNVHGCPASIVRSLYFFHHLKVFAQSCLASQRLSLLCIANAESVHFLAKRHLDLRCRGNDPEAELRTMNFCCHGQRTGMDHLANPSKNLYSSNWHQILPKLCL